MKRRSLEVMGAGVVAAVVIACGDAAMNGAGGMLSDAGEMMSDAGQMMMDAGGQMMSDAGQMMMDAGGELMHDAGEVIRDAGNGIRDAGEVMRDGSTGMMDSAMAQSCEACSAGGRPTVVTAENDVDQLRGETIERSGWTEQRGAAYTVLQGGPCPDPVQARAFTAEVVEGPFVLTDYRSNIGTQLYTVAAGAACFENGQPESSTFFTGCTNPAQITGQRLQRPQSSRTILIGTNAETITGARVWIPSGQKLCAFAAISPLIAVADPALTTNAIVAWSGFAPYE